MAQQGGTTDDQALLQMIQGLEDRARDLVATRLTCNCGSGLQRRKGDDVHRNPAREIEALENRVRDFVVGRRPCYCGRRENVGNRNARDADHHRGSADDIDGHPGNRQGHTPEGGQGDVQGGGNEGRGDDTGSGSKPGQQQPMVPAGQLTSLNNVGDQPEYGHGVGAGTVPGSGPGQQQTVVPAGLLPNVNNVEEQPGDGYRAGTGPGPGPGRSQQHTTVPTDQSQNSNIGDQPGDQDDYYMLSATSDDDDEGDSLRNEAVFQNLLDIDPVYQQALNQAAAVRPPGPLVVRRRTYFKYIPTWTDPRVSASGTRPYPYRRPALQLEDRVPGLESDDPTQYAL